LVASWAAQCVEAVGPKGAFVKWPEGVEQRGLMYRAVIGFENRDDIDWWFDRLSNEDTKVGNCLDIVLAVRFGSGRVLRSIADLVESRLRLLAPEHDLWVSDYLVHFGRFRQTWNMQRNSIERLASNPNLAALVFSVSRKGKAGLLADIVGENISALTPGCSSAAASQALALALSGDLPWEIALKLVKNGHKPSSQSTDDRFEGFYGFRISRDIPEDVAAVILDGAADFPPILVRFADARMQGNIQSKVIKALQYSDEQRWLS
jgi:hypothetical protein